MRHFNISYTAYFNRRYRRSGHLYQGRYHSFLIDADNYLKEVSRYIHLNPVNTKQASSKDAAARGKALRSYVWSSFPGYVSPRARKSFLR
jgi:putative transposase